MDHDAGEKGRAQEGSDALIIGTGLSGLVAAAELLDAGKSVTLLEQEPEQNLGGQAWWSFGGLFLVNSPEQRHLGVRDSLDLARQDWFGSAEFDRPEDDQAMLWADAYLDFAAGEKRDWLYGLGIRFFPVVGWAERGGYSASGHGNSVPRFHVLWGTGPGVLDPFIARVRRGVEEGRAQLRFRHRVDELVIRDGAVVGARGAVLADDAAVRGAPTNRDVVGEFELEAGAVIVSSGGIGGDHDLVRAQWPAWLGSPPERMLAGVPAHVDGRMLAIAHRAGGRLVNGDRMWHYVEGIQNHSPVWAGHGIRILPGPSSMWFDAEGRRLPGPLYPGFDTLGTLEWLRQTGHDHSWFVLDQRIIEKEFALSGSEQNPDLTGRSVTALLRQRLGRGAPEPVEAFKRQGADFVVADTIDELLDGMRQIAPEAELDTANVRAELVARDREVRNRFSKDGQVTALRGARRYLGDRLIRTARPHEILNPSAGPLIAVKLHVITRKTLGGIQTNLHAQVLDAAGAVIPGLYAAGEAAGFGGGGMHGYRSLEGTFLGACLFTGRVAGRAVAAGL
ncbi:MAG: FAD-binding dehydrogenase [Micrococcales bacterium]|nr:FAD-binding dehydrogenase [Micrococcales bacterium]